MTEDLNLAPLIGLITINSCATMTADGDGNGKAVAVNCIGGTGVAVGRGVDETGSGVEVGTGVTVGMRIEVGARIMSGVSDGAVRVGRIAVGVEETTMTIEVSDGGGDAACSFAKSIPANTRMIERIITKLRTWHPSSESSPIWTDFFGDSSDWLA